MKFRPVSRNIEHATQVEGKLPMLQINPSNNATVPPALPPLPRNSAILFVSPPRPTILPEAANDAQQQVAAAQSSMDKSMSSPGRVVQAVQDSSHTIGELNAATG